MGNWNTTIKGNDTTLDIYGEYKDLCKSGISPKEASEQILKDRSDYFEDEDCRHDALFGLALGQWESRALESWLLEEVKSIIESGSNLEVWSGLGADEKQIKSRKKVLDNFLFKILIMKK